ncbi:MAG: glycerate kinase [Syntrophorhabdaceae bacterium]|nr:glycerate kinase [Syntrophorhabdaceae bacterium]
MTPKERRDAIVDIFTAGLRAVDPARSVRQRMPHVLDICRERGITEVEVVGFGKGAVTMARAAMEELNDQVHARGIVLTKYGHVHGAVFRGEMEVYEAGHPIPDQAGHDAAQKVLEVLTDADETMLVLFLISGGGSALLAAPAEGISLADKQSVTDLLLRSGATIDELNTVRKHLSRVKGGRLAKAAYPAHGISLILSDVIGDRLDVIASGPTAPDPSTYADALGVLGKYDLTGAVPANVMKILRDGVAGILPETPKKGDPVFENFENIIIAGNQKATRAAELRAVELGFNAVAPANNVEGEARKLGERYARAVRSTQGWLSVPDRQSMCFIYGGEPTVTVKGNGKGGRNTELALAFALAVEGMEGVTFLSAGTDGTDGPTDAAGAIVDGGTVKMAREKGLKAEEYLERNDSYSFFKETGELLITGPTGTNVMDLHILLIEAGRGG